MSSRLSALIRSFLILTILANFIPSPPVARAAVSHDAPGTSRRDAQSPIPNIQSPISLTWLPIFTLPPDPPSDAEHVSSLTLYAERPLLAADGADTVRLLAFLADEQGRPAPDGSAVTWHADPGLRVVAQTPSREGLAGATLQAGERAGQFVVRASAGAARDAITLTLTAAEARPLQLDQGDATQALAGLQTRARNTIRSDRQGRPFVDGPWHRATFEAGAVTVTPVNQGRALSSLDFSYRLVSVRAGRDELLDLGTRPAPQIARDRAHYRWDETFYEEYLALDGGVEQRFVLARKPALDGDLVIEGQINTALRPEYVSDEEGIVFYHPETGEVILIYGGALAYDAAGEQLRVKLRLAGDRLCLELPQEWLERAIYPVTVDPLIGSHFAVASASGIQGAPDVVYNDAGQEFLVVWHDNRGGNYDIYAQRLSSTGALIGGNYAVITATGDQKFPALAYNPAVEEYLLLWQDGRNGANDRVYGRRLSGAGTPLGASFVLSDTTANQQRADLAADAHTGAYLAVWAQDGAGDWDVYARRVLSDGVVAGTPLTVALGSGDQDNPSLDFGLAADEYLVAWEQDGAARGRRFSAAGAALGDEVSIGDGVGPVVVYNDRVQEYMVTVADASKTHLNGHRVGPTGAALGSSELAAVQSPPYASGYSYDVAVDDTGTYLVLWVEMVFFGFFYQVDVYAQQASAAGEKQGTAVAVDANAPAGPSLSTVAYSPDAREYLLVWGDMFFDLYARRFAPLRADFEAAPVGGLAPLTVVFTDTSTPAGDIESWAWDFGDGESSNTRHPTHTYTLSGTYSVALTVTAGAEWDVERRTTYVTVGEGGVTVTADFAGTPVSGSVPLTVTFTNLSTSSGEIDGYAWSFGDGPSGTSVLTDPVYVYTQTGSYTVVLTATSGSESDVEVKSDYISVTAVSPVTVTANFVGAPVSGTAPLTVTFTNLSTSSGEIDSYEWDFGDGGSSDEQHPTHIYPISGTYTVALTVTAGSEWDVERRPAYINVGSGPELSLSKRAPATALPGDGVTYTLWVTNSGGVAATGVTVTDTLPTELFFITTTLPTASYLSDTHQVRWDVGPLAAGETLSLSVGGQVKLWTERGPVVNRATLRAPGVALTATATTTVEAAALVTATVTPAGGGTLAEGPLRLVFPSGAVTQTTLVTLTTAPGRALTPTQRGMAFSFHLYPELQFETPLTLTLALTDLIAFQELPRGHRPYLAYRADPARERWDYLPLREVDWHTGVLTAELSHFSGYGTGVISENGWQMHLNEPAVSRFRGSLSYGYPLALPPGRGGVGPGLALSYNSDRMDGMFAETQADWAGLGWSLDAPQIARAVHWCPWGNPKNGHVQLCSGAKYSLLINGTSYELVPEQPGADLGRYHTAEESYFYVEHKSGASNQKGTYWVVKTRDGTTYEFGQTTDAEQVLCDFPDWGVPGLDKQVYRWRLNRISDVWGNEAVFQYDEEVNDAYHCQRASYLRDVYYNWTGQAWGAQVHLARGQRTGEDGTDQNHYLFFQREYLAGVLVWAGGALLREYRLDYDFEPEQGSTAQTRRLVGITEYGAGGQAGGAPTLPPTTFHYQLYDNTKPDKEWGNGDTYPYSRLWAVDNGYGGRVEVDYEAHALNDQHGYHYRVTETRSSDGWEHTARRAYTYGPACMDATGSKCDDGNRGWGLTGYEWSREQLYDYDGSLLSQNRQDFVLAWPLTGRVGEQEVADAAGIPQARTETAWAYDWLISPTLDYASGVAFYHTEGVTETTLSGGETKRRYSTYEYDDYGDVIAEYQYGDWDDPDDQRTVRRTYVHNTDDATWLIGLPSSEKLFAGIITDPGSVTPEAASYTFYETDPPAQPAPLKVAALEPDGPYTSTFGYDGYGNVLTQTNALGQRTTTQYDDVYNMFPVKSCVAPGSVLEQCSHTEYYGVNGPGLSAQGAYFGAAYRAWGPNGQATASAQRYDAFGRVLTIVRPGDSWDTPSTIYAYDDVYAVGERQLVRVRAEQRERHGQGGTLVAAAFYDGLGRTLQTRAETAGAEPAVSAAAYDALGRAVTAYQPYFDTTAGVDTYSPVPGGTPETTTHYDALGRSTQVDYADGTHTRSAYLGWTTVVTDANNHQMRHVNDAYGQLTRVYEYTNTGSPELYATTAYTYDVRGNLIAVEDTLGHTTAITYDQLGRKVGMDDPDMGVWGYEYDLIGNLITQTDAMERELVFQYDDLNRLVGKFASGQVLATYSYDEGDYGVGMRTGMAYPGGAAAYRYDERGRLEEERRTFYLSGADPLTYSVGYGYDALDRVTDLTYPDGEVVHQAYDAGGMPLSLSGDSAYVDAATYNPAGQLLELALGNGLATAYSYDPLNWRLTGLQTAPAVGDALQDLSYTYDDVGNVLSIADAVLAETQHFDYDPLDRLIHAYTEHQGDPEDYDRDYGYDEVGNLAARRHELGGWVAYTYSLTQPHAVTTLGDGTFSARYDANGNMIWRAEISGTQMMTYEQEFDAENRLTQVTNLPISQSTHFYYDGDGARIAQAVDDVSTLYVGELYEVQLPPGMALDTTPPPAPQAALPETLLAAAAAKTSEVSLRALLPWSGTLAQSPGRTLTGNVHQNFQSREVGDTREASRGRSSRAPGLAMSARTDVVWSDNLSVRASPIEDYTGPGNRTVEECSWDAAIVQYDAPSCYPDPPWQNGDICGDGSPHWYPDPHCDPLGQWPCEDGRRYTCSIVTYDPATVEGTVDCTWGSNGWCVSAATLTIVGTEPMPNETITHIEGDRDGVPFSDAGSSTTKNVNDTSGTTFTYWAVSSFGDTSLQESSTIKVDTTPPSVNTGLGSGWNPGANPSATDATSGIQTRTFYVDGQSKTWKSYGDLCSELNLGDGDHTASVHATNQAGIDNDTGNQTFWCDRTPPVVNTGLESGWNPGANPSATDATSGIQTRTFYVDGQSKTWKSYGDLCSELNLGDGDHTARVYAEDNAGHTDDTGNESFPCDRTPPGSWTGFSPTGWQVDMPITASVVVQDTVSGLNFGSAYYKRQYAGEGWSGLLPASHDGNTLVSGSLSYAGQSDQAIKVQFQIEDVAGNPGSSPVYTIAVDNEDPAPGQPAADPTPFSPNYPSGDGVKDQTTLTATIVEPYLSSWTLDVLDGAQVVRSFEGSGQNVDVAWDGRDDQSGQVADGEYDLRLTAYDQAGNDATVIEYQAVELDTQAPAVEVTYPDADDYPTRQASIDLQGHTERVDDAVTVDGTPVAVDDQANFTATVTLVEGSNAIVVRSEDRAGNATSVTRTVIYDPHPPVIGDEAPTGVVDETTPTLSATFSDVGDSGVNADSAVIRLDGVDYSAEATVSAGGFSYVAGPLDERPEPYPVYVYVEDAAGNSATSDYTFTLDLGTWITLTSPGPADRLNTLTTTVLGQAEAGVTVNLAVNGIPAGATLADEGKDYSFVGVALSAGPNTLLVTATDALAHQATASVQVVVDTTRPGASASVTPNPFSDATVFKLRANGLDNDPVNAWTLTVRDAGGQAVTRTLGLGQPDGYRVRWDGRQLGGGLAPEGDYGYTFYVTTTTGVTNATGTQGLSIDRSAPGSPAILYPATGSYFSQPATAVSGTAEPRTRVSVFNDGVFWETADADGTGQWHLPRALPVLGGGWHVITATASDVAGNVSPPSEPPVEIALSVDPPLFTHTVTVSPWLVTTGSVVTLHAEGRGDGYPPPGAPVAWVSATLPTGEALALTALSSGPITSVWESQWTLPAGAPEGNRPVAFDAEDTALPPLASHVSVPLVIDATPPPRPKITSPDPDEVLPAASWLVSGRAERHSQVTVYAGGAPLVSTPAGVWDDRDENWQVTVQFPDDGVYVLQARATDAAGNLSEFSAPVTVTVDTQPPEVTNALASPWALRTYDEVEVSTDAQDATSGVEQVWATYLRPQGGTVALYYSTMERRWSNSYVVELQDDGFETLTVTAVDGAGHTGWMTTQVAVDNTPPVASLYQIAESSPHAYVAGDVVYYSQQEPGGSFEVRVSANDATSGLEMAVYLATVSGGHIYEGSGMGGPFQYAHSYDFSPASDEEGTYPVTVYDYAGNWTAVPFTVTCDADGPAVTVSASGVPTITVEWNANDGGGAGIVGTYDVQVREDGGPWTGWLTDTAQTQAEYVGQSGHQYTFRVTATDRVGNVGQGQASAVIAAVTKYYYFGGQRVAMRGPDDVVVWLHGDHLGSTSLATDAGQAVVSRQLYYPFGEQRWAVGTLPTDFGFTGQRHDTSTGLHFFHARYYHSGLGRFVSADNIIPSPGDPQNLNRYSYVLNNPLLYRDPTGHQADACGEDDWECHAWEWIHQNYSQIAGVAWEDLDVRARLVFLNLGWTPEQYNVEFVHGNARSLSMTAEDPFLWLAGGAAGGRTLMKLGPAILTAIEAAGPEAAAMIKLRLWYGLAGGVGSGVAYTAVNLVTGNDFDAGDFFAAVTIGSLSGAFPEAGGSGIGAAILRGAGANEAQYILGSLLSGKDMSIEGHAISLATGGIFGFFGNYAGDNAFSAAKQNVDDYAMRVWSGASSYAGGAVRASLASAKMPAMMEGGRTALLEWGNNLWQAIATDLTTDYSP